MLSYYYSECNQPLGMENGLIKDDQIWASSYLGPNHKPFHARLNREIIAGISAHGWTVAGKHKFVCLGASVSHHIGSRRG